MYELVVAKGGVKMHAGESVSVPDTLKAMVVSCVAGAAGG